MYTYTGRYHDDLTNALTLLLFSQDFFFFLYLIDVCVAIKYFSIFYMESKTLKIVALSNFQVIKIFSLDKRY